MPGIPKPPISGPSLLVTQVKSAIGTKPKHRATLRALGLRRLGHQNLLPDRPEIRGMLARVPHLVTVDESVAPDPKPSVARRGSAKASSEDAS